MSTERRKATLGRIAFAMIAVIVVVARAGPSLAQTQPPASAPPPAPTQVAAVSDASPDAIARRTVESFHRKLIEVMKSASDLPFSSRRDKMTRAVEEAFDMVLMAKTSIGPAWKDLDEAARRDWVDLSGRYSASNYAKNFDGWSGQTFETHGVEPAARGTILVKTEFVQPSGDNVLFDYRLRKINSSWRVIDVQIDGKVSEITLRRANYRSVIKRKGFATLIVEVEEKIEEFERP